MPTLLVSDGDSAGVRVDIAGEVVIGRADADLTLSDPEVSRRHAVVRDRGGILELTDLGSLNGTWVNGVRVTAPTQLAAGDSLRVGTTTIAVEVAQPPVPMEPTRAGAATTPPPAPPSPPPAEAPPSGGFAPPTLPQRRRAPATRGTLGVVLTFAAVGLTAVLLILYFALRG
jgi:pSer/pThr/pTyr-binding forkhead associated (FHA) protein